ncbi:hypothetical protein NPIL_679101 [Nephila pilipes]|uniref:Uncharacterized protein n=1 Tax=Nephila pilipes TaxID=299642 RepID=A0A8X6NLG5_NEPPI|nr:hypothetical protein NPIL_679101 [Nephila pilipes]
MFADVRRLPHWISKRTHIHSIALQSSRALLVFRLPGAPVLRSSQRVFRTSSNCQFNSFKMVPEKETAKSPLSHEASGLLTLR